MWDSVHEMRRFLKAVGTEFKLLLGALGLTILRFWKPLYGKDIPNPVFWFGVGACLYLAVFSAWRKEHRGALLGSAFREGLRARCGDLVLKWEELAELYQNSVKEDGNPATLQEPMATWWASSEWKYLPYKVGFLQAATITLRQDLETASVPLQPYNVRISLPALLKELRTYRERIP
jgi:hypothetical protein